MKIVRGKIQGELDGDDYIMLHKAQLELICFKEEELRSPSARILRRA